MFDEQVQQAVPAAFIKQAVQPVGRGAPFDAVTAAKGQRRAGQVLAQRQLEATLKIAANRAGGPSDRIGQAASRISDIAGDPVIDGGRVYVGNISGGLVALDAFSGERIWTATEGAVSPVWPTGGSVFLVNDLNQLVRLDASDGSVIWRVQLPEFFDTGTFRSKRTVFAHYGPVLAGGRLIVASSDGQVREFSPTSGALIGATALDGGAASNPVVASGTLYVVTKAGQLVAFR